MARVYFGNLSRDSSTAELARLVSSYKVKEVEYMGKHGFVVSEHSAGLRALSACADAKLEAVREGRWCRPLRTRTTRATPCVASTIPSSTDGMVLL